MELDIYIHYLPKYIRKKTYLKLYNKKKTVFYTIISCLSYTHDFRITSELQKANFRYLQHLSEKKISK